MMLLKESAWLILTFHFQLKKYTTSFWLFKIWFRPIWMAPCLTFLNFFWTAPMNFFFWVVISCQANSFVILRLNIIRNERTVIDVERKKLNKSQIKWYDEFISNQTAHDTVMTTWV